MRNQYVVREDSPLTVALVELAATEPRNWNVWPPSLDISTLNPTSSLELSRQFNRMRLLESGEAARLLGAAGPSWYWNVDDHAGNPWPFPAAVIEPASRDIVWLPAIATGLVV